MKEYLLFAGTDYFGSRGFDSFRIKGSRKECEDYWRNNQSIITDGLDTCSWAQLVDCDLMKITFIGFHDQGDDGFELEEELP